MSVIGKLVKAGLDTIALPVAVTKDILTLGGATCQTAGAAASSSCFQKAGAGHQSLSPPRQPRRER